MLAVCKSVGFGFISAAAALKVVQTCTSWGDGILKGCRTTKRAKELFQDSTSEVIVIRVQFLVFHYCHFVRLTYVIGLHLLWQLQGRASHENSGLTLSFTLLSSFILLSWSVFFFPSLSLMSVSLEVKCLLFHLLNPFAQVQVISLTYLAAMLEMCSERLRALPTQFSTHCLQDKLYWKKSFNKPEFLPWQAHDLPSPLCKQRCIYFPSSCKVVWTIYTYWHLKARPCVLLATWMFSAGSTLLCHRQFNKSPCLHSSQSVFMHVSDSELGEPFWLQGPEWLQILLIRGNAAAAEDGWSVLMSQRLRGKDASWDVYKTCMFFSQCRHMLNKKQS